MTRYLRYYFTPILLGLLTLNVAARGAGKGVIPFRVDSIGAPAYRSVAIIVSAEVNGVKADFTLDTGASVHVVTPEMAEQLGLRMTDDSVSVAGNELTGARRAIARRLKVGNIVMRNVPFYVMALDVAVPDSLQPYTRNLQAILGLPLLKLLKTCDIDFDRHEIRSVKSEKTEAEERNLTYDSTLRTLLVEARHTGERMPMLVDTGATHSTLGHDFYAAHCHRLIADGEDSVIYAGYGGMVSGREYRLTDFEINIGHNYTSLPLITVFDSDYDQRLGMDYFSRFRHVWIDFRRMTLRVL
jgi:predicted aspartyl protease